MTKKPREATSCQRCGGWHFGTGHRCPFLDAAICTQCGGVIPAEVGTDWDIHPLRRFGSLGHVYHLECQE